MHTTPQATVIIYLPDTPGTEKVCLVTVATVHISFYWFVVWVVFVFWSFIDPNRHDCALSADMHVGNTESTSSWTIPE